MSPQEALRRLRAEVGLTQIEMAEKLNIGFVTLNRWENGKSFPSRANANNIIRTAKNMGVSGDCLNYLSNVLLPSRMRGRPATGYGFPALEQELLCQMVDDSPAGVVVIDEESKRIIYVNRRAEEFTGKSFFVEEERHCWSYLKGLDAPCAVCDSERYPLTGFYERYDTFQNGLRLKNRTKSIMWKGKKVYVLYITSETEYSGSDDDERLSPAGAEAGWQTAQPKHTAKPDNAAAQAENRRHI